jgi:hypothetical protein
MKTKAAPSLIPLLCFSVEYIFLNALIAACCAVALCRRAFTLICPFPPFFASFALCSIRERCLSLCSDLFALILPVKSPIILLENAVEGWFEGGRKVSGWVKVGQAQSNQVKVIWRKVKS